MRETLYELKNESIWISIEIYYSKEEELIIHGHDSGKIVKKITDNYDYEYFLTLQTPAIEALIQKQELKNREELVDWFKKNFSNEKAMNQIKERLNQLQIKYKFFVW